MNEENVVADNSNTAREEVSPQDTNNVDFDTNASSDEDVINARLQKAEELAKNYKIRAEKAEKELKNKGADLREDISQKDLYALMNSKVHEDDINEVTDYAKLKKLSISEALKQSFVKTLLKDKEEQRKIAQAVNTGSTRPISSKLSDEALMEKAQKGQLPESDADIQRLWRVRRGLKG